ncbi:MAG: hypothetical protein ACOC6A_05150 [Chloroflexota bacterium]
MNVAKSSRSALRGALGQAEAYLMAVFAVGYQVPAMDPEVDVPYIARAAKKRRW